ncbi:MAG: DUF87 domain-containing protein [Desulfobulbaceae bacterium]|nr:DUF87 domain-containing protein [Desulfobulbaceae bacterium]
MIQRALTVEEICNKLRPVFGKKIDEVYFQYTVADGREEREEIVHILNSLYQKHLSQLLDKGVLLEPPREELIDGTYDLGTINYAGKKLFDFKLREKDWPRHICVSGMSGSGKTTFAFKVVEALNKHHKPYLIFDWKKSFRPLSANDSGIMTFTVGDESVSNLFKTNINQPPKGVAPKEWINVLSDLLTESFSASFGVHKVILETLDEAFKEWGIYSGSENYPTWNHIKWRLEEKLEKVQGREAGWLESALRIATVMTFGEFGKTVNYKGDNSISVEELLDKKVVMELNSLGNIEKTFFCEFVLTYIYKLKKARQNQADAGFDHAIIVDEAHNIFLKKPTSFSNETTTDMIYREMREYGTSLICLDQHISKISDTVKGNSACHIAFQQQLPQDIYDVSEIMSLRENKNYFSQLPVGSAIVKLSERYTMPFLIDVPYAEMRNKQITNEYIKNRMQAMMMGKDYENKVDPEFNEAIENPKVIEQPVVTEKPKVAEKPKIKTNTSVTDDLSETQKIIYDFVMKHLDNGASLEEIEKNLERGTTQGNYTESDLMKVINLVFESQLSLAYEKVENVKHNNLQSDETIFLEFLRNNPEHNLSTTEIYKQLGLSARKGTFAKKGLEEKGLIKIEEVKYNKGWKKLIRLNH